MKPSLPGSMTSSTTRSKDDALRRSSRCERGLAGVDDIGLVAFGLEVEPQAVGEMLLVLDDEDTRLHVHAVPGAVAAAV